MGFKAHDRQFYVGIKAATFFRMKAVTVFFLFVEMKAAAV